MTPELEQLQKEAREEFKKTRAYEKLTVLSDMTMNDLEFFLDTLIAKAFLAGEESGKKETAKEVKDISENRAGVGLFKYINDVLARTS